MSAASQIRIFSPAEDAPWLHLLWHKTMHPRWSLPIDAMGRVLAGVRTLLVAERDGLRVGFCAADHVRLGDAGLLSLLVEPAYQRRGIGHGLLAHLDRLLQAEQVRRLHLGAISSGSYFWPGVPAEHDATWPFFARHRWQQQESCADLVQELAGFQTPGWVSGRLTEAGVILRLSEPRLRSAIVAFERTCFPAWSHYFENELAASQHENLLVAQASDGEIVGSLLLKADTETPWQEDAGARVGSLNTLGIAPARERQGIGLALAAQAMEILRDRGCSRCYIQWTGLREWYGKLGARVWAEYRMATKTLPNAV